MSEQDSVQLISEVLTKVTKRKTDISLDTNLLEHLDSLDGMVFLLELEERSGKTFPDTNLVTAGYFKVDKLARFLANPN
jgi:acyl carrier protein